MRDIDLFREALIGLGRAHAPYSGHKVGASLYTECGYCIIGGNVESSSSKCSVCAETFVMSQAVITKRVPKRLCIVSMHSQIVTPCGFCRQFLVDFPTVEVLLFNNDGSRKAVFSVADLMPSPYIRVKE